MTTYDRGDVVFVPFLFTDKPAAKNRPAVVVSSERYHRSRSDIVIAGITSNTTRTGFVGQVVIRDWRSCGLDKPSVISGIIMTVRDVLIGDRLGSLSPGDLRSLDSSLKEMLGL